MTVSMTFDPRSATDLEEARRTLDFFESVPPNTARVSQPSANPAQSAIDDLWSRLGARGRELVAKTASFEGRFTLVDLAKRTGDNIGTIKSRWANLGRSLRKISKTHGLHGPFRVYEEHIPAADGDGLWSFTMPTAVREAVRSKV